MAGGVDLDELLNARARMNEEKARTQPGGKVGVAPEAAEDLTFLRLLGLWLLVTGLLLIKIVVSVLVAMAEVMEWFRRGRTSPRRRR